ncbi:hypothetical protein, partial [Mycobacteroides abscessus]|uniref:hypothetical protein n=1 Tax=Mycobacteroides abscessus TaxID=36809 RepID=UPI001F2991AD
MSRRGVRSGEFSEPPYRFRAGPMGFAFGQVLSAASYERGRSVLSLLSGQEMSKMSPLLDCGTNPVRHSAGSSHAMVAETRAGG